MTPEDFPRNTHRYRTKRTAQSFPEAHKDARHCVAHTDMLHEKSLRQILIQTQRKPQSHKYAQGHRPSGTDTDTDTKIADAGTQVHSAHSKITHRTKEGEAHRSINPQGQSETGTPRDPRGT